MPELDDLKAVVAKAVAKMQGDKELQDQLDAEREAHGKTRDALNTAEGVITQLNIEMGKMHDQLAALTQGV